MTYWLWAPPAAEGFSPSRASMHLITADEAVESRVLETAALAAVSVSPPRFGGYAVGLWIAQQVTVPREPVVTRIEYELEVTGARGAHSWAATIEVSDYVQRVSLIFPVKGNFAIVFGHASEGDHMERSQAFGYDIAPLGRRYELLRTGDGTRNEHFAGWGREIRAPAAGVVVRMQADVPDNPTPGAVIDLEARPEGHWAVLGNGLVIDHGHSEYSLLGHLMKGSLMVREGDRVDAGQVVGRMGNSGHSSGPHLHYHLMDGPELFRSNGLPSRFVGTETATPRRGAIEAAN
jgi:murein DD-endopeptidase MepM/ murein hydrolase activator NlpD